MTTGIYVNAIGEKIVARELTDKDKYLKSLSMTYDRKVIQRLSPTDFKTWLYGIDPRIALLIANDPRFRAVMVYQCNRSKFKRTKDFIWRLFHGVPL